MAGIYIHIPFCKQACTYCDFHFSTNQKLRLPLIEAICKEVEQRKEELNFPIDSIYFGGGSPSILNENELNMLFEALHHNYDLSAIQEITFESNPDDHTSEKLGWWKQLGINRLSVGIQSFIDRDLNLMNRAHNAQHAEQCVQAARSAGFDSLTLDLIYGIPGQSGSEWQWNIQQALELSPDHISAYCLTVEPKTALDHQIKKGLLKEKHDEEIEEAFLFLHHELEANGYVHYEISNFGKEGKQAIHNSNYWNGNPYLGIGPAAHSFDGKSKRRWNVSNNSSYIRSLNDGNRFWEAEELSITDINNERMMTGLRRKQGVDLTSLDSAYLVELLNNVEQMNAGLRRTLLISDARIAMMPDHWLMNDAVLKSLFVID